MISSPNRQERIRDGEADRFGGLEIDDQLEPDRDFDRQIGWARALEAAKQRDELAALHSITSSAAACSVSGTVRPSACAVLRLITSSNCVGCRTGISAGFEPFRICPT